MRNLFAFLAGSLFGVGLLVSGMTDTTKVQGWLDIFGDWDPTLAFVLTGAIIPMAIAWRFTEGRRPLAGGVFPEKPSPAAGAQPRHRLHALRHGLGAGRPLPRPRDGLAQLRRSRRPRVPHRR